MPEDVSTNDLLKQIIDLLAEQKATTMRTGFQQMYFCMVVLGCNGLSFWVSLATLLTIGWTIGWGLWLILFWMPWLMYVAIICIYYKPANFWRLWYNQVASWLKNIRRRLRR